MKQRKPLLVKYETFIGVIERVVQTKKDCEVHIVVDTTLIATYTIGARFSSMLTPGMTVVLKVPKSEHAKYKENAKLLVSATVEKHKKRKSAVYVADKYATTKEITDIEAWELVAKTLPIIKPQPETNREPEPPKSSRPIYQTTPTPPTPQTPPVQSMKTAEIDKMAIYRKFLSDYTPASIADALDTRIVGQSELTRSAADFLYYHALRQLKPNLPPRPMLISGPSGTGKTEVWRVAKTLFKDVFNIEIIDGAGITQEGWKGDNKLSSHIDQEIADGGILIIDEFDKLSKTDYSSTGTNIAARLQSEFLKLLEGEYTKKEQSRSVSLARPVTLSTLTSISSETTVNTKQMGIVLVGAFEDIRDKRQSKVGFGHNDASNKSSNESRNITDEEFIEFGVIPELIGRVAIKTTTNQLSDDEYIQIIHNPFSRVAMIINTFKELGIDVDGILQEDDIKELIKRSKTNKTGVRWVSAQIESRMLAAIQYTGVGNIPELDKPEEMENNLENNKDDEDPQLDDSADENKKTDNKKIADDEFFF